MEHFILFIHPSIWNVCKFILLNLIATPIIEALLEAFLASKATYDVLRGTPVAFCDSRLAIFALHGTYWGKSRNRIWLVLSALLLLSVELLFEFSFSASTVHVGQQQQVWLAPLHNARYFAPDNVVLADEPTRFPDVATRMCVQGPHIMTRSILNHTASPLISAVLRYELQGQYLIRTPYLASDNFSVHCSMNSTNASAQFVVPFVVQREKFEGFSAICDISTSVNDSWWQLFFQQSMETANNFSFGDKQFAISVGERAVCVQSWEVLQSLCTLWNGSSIAIAITSGRNLRCLPMIISGPAAQGLRDKGRQVRLLAHLVEKRTFSPDASDMIEYLIAKPVLERLTLTTLLIANEQGVNGVRHLLANRTVVLPQRRSVTTMSPTGLIPAGILMSITTGLLFADFLVRVLISRESPQVGWWQRMFRQWRVPMSKQWMRKKLSEDFERLTGCRAHSTDIRIRLAKDDELPFTERLKVLPDTP